MAKLTEFEKGQILALQREMLPIRKIADAFIRSSAAVFPFLKPKKRTPPTPKASNAKNISTTQESALVGMAAYDEETAKTPKNKL